MTNPVSSGRSSPRREPRREFVFAGKVRRRALEPPVDLPAGRALQARGLTGHGQPRPSRLGGHGRHEAAFPPARSAKRARLEECRQSRRNALSDGLGPAVSRLIG